MGSFLHRMMLDDLAESHAHRQPPLKQDRIRWAYHVIAPRAVHAALNLLKKGATIEQVEQAIDKDRAEHAAAFREVSASHAKQARDYKAEPHLHVDGCTPARRRRG